MCTKSESQYRRSRDAAAQRRARRTQGKKSKTRQTDTPSLLKLFPVHVIVCLKRASAPKEVVSAFAWELAGQLLRFSYNDRCVVHSGSQEFRGRIPQIN